jgi:uncharacterized protein (DUF1697 family)
MPAPSHIAFLRAINVGGRFVKMDVLCDHFRALGQQQVSSFINTGNIWFSPVGDTGEAMATHLTTDLAPLLGFTSEVFVRSRAQLRATVAAASALPRPPDGDVNILFLAAPLTAAQSAVLDALRSERDVLQVQGQELFWASTVLQSKSTLNNAVFERTLKLRTTLRRVNTLQMLLAAWPAEH